MKLRSRTSYLKQKLTRMQVWNETASQLRQYYPETIHHVFVLNTSLALKASSIIITSSLGKRTLNKITHGTTSGSSKDCESTMNKIFDMIPKTFIPEEFRGRFEICDPTKDVIEIAKETGVDLRCVRNSHCSSVFSH